MNYIAKALIAMLVCMAALIGPTVATTIEISTCPEDGFGMIPLAPGEVIQEGIYSNGPEFYISSNGMVQYLGDPVEAPSYTSINYGMEVGAPYLRLVWITLLPCEPEPPACECEPNDPGDNIQITAPTTIGQTIRSSWSVPEGNGNWELSTWVNGVKTSKWNGEYPVEVIAKEFILDEETFEITHTGYEISDCICG